MAENTPKKAPKPKGPPKPIHATASPYRAPTIDKIRQPHHDIIVDRLVKYSTQRYQPDIPQLSDHSVLTPITAWRAQGPVSKGKKSKKRKRNSQPAETNVKPAESSRPPPIQQHLLLGFNHVTRHLEDLSTLSAPQVGSKTPLTRTYGPSKTSNAPPISTNAPQTSTTKQHTAVLFLFHPLDDLIYSHLPTLCHTASLAHAELPATRLILLDPTVEKRVAKAVGLQRVSVLGVLGVSDEGEGWTAETEGLVRYVREHVQPVEAECVREVRQGAWLGTRVESR